jgi:hypothetical protein
LIGFVLVGASLGALYARSPGTAALVAGLIAAGVVFVVAVRVVRGPGRGAQQALTRSDRFRPESMAELSFPMGLRDTVGMTLRLVSSVARPGVVDVQPGRSMAPGFWLLAEGSPVAYLRYRGKPWHTLMEIACSDERWQLTNSEQERWRLDLERTKDKVALGCYRMQRWRGGIVELRGGPRVLVSKRRGGRWCLQLDGEEPFAEIAQPTIRWHADEALRLSLSFAPQDLANLHLAVLTVSGALLLRG